MMDLNAKAEAAIRMVRESKELAYDTETSGVDWKANQPIGYVLTSPEASVYLPIRHGGGGNLPGVPPMKTPTDEIVISDFERELAKAFKSRAETPLMGRVIGHHMKFDVHMSANAGVMLGRNLGCTQNMHAMLDEYSKEFSLDACSKAYGVTPKLGDDLYKAIAAQVDCAPTRKSMEHFWRMPGNHPTVMDYAEGDGVSTLELWDAQMRRIVEEDMEFIAGLENDLIWTIFRMERRGIRVDLDEVGRLREATEAKIREVLMGLPTGFNVRSPTQIKDYMVEQGLTDWPTTDKGNPSFTEKWLKKSEQGRKIIQIRQMSNLINSFINPLQERHIHKGRVHATLNQLKADMGGTVSGRFSCQHPNLQQVPKRLKEIAKPFRRLFVADPGYIFWERDYSQCLVAGTQVMVPGGTKNIEDILPGDDVYSYDNNGRLVIRRVLDSWCTGERETVKIKWRTNGRTEGELECTPDHPIRLINGTYKTPQQMCEDGSSGKRGATPYWVPVMALRRTQQRAGSGDYKATYLYSTGRDRVKEARFVFEHYAGYSPEHVHHVDGDPSHNWPENLQGMGAAEHGALHNHAITHIIPQPGKRRVYDITVEDTHNFIANEICVHNCEPRLFAHYSGDKALVEGYNSKPFRDAHQVVADLLNVERDPTAKRMNMGIFTGMQVRTFSEHMGWPESKAAEAWHQWYAEFPGVRDFQTKAKNRLKNRGWVKTLLGRRCRLEHPRFAYRGTSKIIQGSNADIIKLKLLEADRMCEDAGDIVQIHMTVHDSFNGQYQDTPEARALFEQIVAHMGEVQVAPYNLRVPFLLEGEEGANWSEATFGKEAAS